MIQFKNHSTKSVHKRTHGVSKNMSPEAQTINPRDKLLLEVDSEILVRKCLQVVLTV